MSGDLTLFSLSNSNLAGSHLRGSGNTYIGSEGRMVSVKELGVGERHEGENFKNDPTC